MRPKAVLRLTVVAALAAVGLLGVVATAEARQVQQYFYSGEFFEAGGSSPNAIAFDGVDHTLLVVGNGDEREGLKVSKLTPTGAPAPFTGLLGEPSSFHTEETLAGAPNVAIAVDESGTATNGDFYMASKSSSNDVASGKVYGYSGAGTPLPGFPFSLPGACGVAVGPNGNIWVASGTLGTFKEYNAAGEATGRSLFVGVRKARCGIAIDAAGNLYVAVGNRLAEYDSGLQFLRDLGPAGSAAAFGGRGAPLLALDRGDATLFELAESGLNPITQVDSTGEPLVSFGGPDPAHFSYEGLGGTARNISVDPQSHRVYVLKGGEVNVFARDSSQVTVPTAITGAAEGLSGAGATLTGKLTPDGVDTTDCRFEWGTSTAYGNVAPCAQGNAFAGGSGENAVSATLSGLKKGTTYHFRLTGKNANGVPGFGRDREFNAVDPPALSEVSADRITSDSARVSFTVNPEGGSTGYRVEVGTDTGYGMSFPVPDAQPSALQSGEAILSAQEESQELSGLAPHTLYHYRVVATNPAGQTASADRTFTTFALPRGGADTCPNALARQQTGAAGLPDCRAYELVSAANTGGFDVRSGLTPGIAPLPTSPTAAGAALYSLRSGTIPGIAGSPTNHGSDPYLATRGEEGWTTRYVGLPADDPFASGPFASPLLGFDASLDSFAFGGSEICKPCFADGSTNVPLRLPDGSLVPGMAGSMNPGPVEPAGTVRAPFSADGSEFVFGTTGQLEPEANSNGTDATIYERNLQAGTTQVVSRLPDGTTIANGNGVAELGISADGSRVVIGRLVSTDAAGNHYYHLYMHVGSSPQTIDLTPGATDGALYDGMNADGSIVYFTTNDALATATEQDTDTSADIYRAEVQGESSTLTRVSVGSGGSGNTDSCNPLPDSFGPHWNVVGSKADCSAAAVAGGGGVAATDGSIFFLSPERLDGSAGIQNAPNLYLAKPGQPPRFVATLESKANGASPLPTRHPFSKGFGSFSSAQSVAVDQSAGYVYVLDASAGSVKRFTSEGAPANFSAGPGAGGNVLTGFSFGSGGPNQTAQVAVDNSGGATDGDVYITNDSAAEPVVKIFGRDGATLGQLTGSGTPETRFGGTSGSLTFPTGVAVAPNGTLYVAGGNSGKVYRYVPSANPVSESDYNATLNFGNASSVPGPLAADANGAVYVHTLGSTGILTQGVRKFSASQFGAAGTQAGALIDSASTSVAVDPKSGYLYVDRGTTIAEYLPDGTLHDVFGSGNLSNSRGVAVLGSAGGSSSTIYATNVGGPRNVSVFDTLPAPSPLVDNPLVTHAVYAADSRHSEDLQVTPSGAAAVFTSTLPLTGFDSGRKEEIFRYDAAAERLDCVSCSPTGAEPSGDATLTAYGSNLTDDGRVFFTTPEPLTLRDANEQADVYEWENGEQPLISTGTSPSASALLSVSANGTDAFFFTRQKLVQGDENGSSVRLYTARVDGGFVHGPPQFQCAAADECRGPGTQPAPPLSAATTAGTPGQFREEPPSCRKGTIRRKGRCVKQQPPAHRHRKDRHKRGSRHGHGGKK